MTVNSEWKWSDPATMSNVVVKPVQAVAVYTTSGDDLVIRQAGLSGDPDSLVIVPRLYARNLLKGIQDQLEDDVSTYHAYPSEGVVLNASPDSSARMTPSQRRMERFQKGGLP